MCEHEEFKELCALAVAGQISQAEWTLLKDHLQICGDCTKLIGDFASTSVDLLQSDEAPGRVSFQEMRRRFIARARSEGVGLSRLVPERVSASRFAPIVAFFKSRSLLFTTAALFLIAAAGVAHFTLVRARRIQTPTVPAVMEAHSTSQTLPLGLRVERASEAGSRLDERAKALEIERDELRQQLATATTFGKQTEAHLKDANSRITKLETALGSAQAREGDLNSQLQQIADALSKARADESAQEVQIAVQQNQIKDLNDQILYERANFERDKVLSAAGKRGQDIIAARNLHIIDVYDANGHGSRQRAFGRVFYIEGRELLFYAYDLSNPSHANTRFYAWGAAGTKSGYVTKLGVLHSDGKDESRWVLRFDDAGILTKIDSIFVTAETAPDLQKPKGERLLYAVITGQPNHP